MEPPAANRYPVLLVDATPDEVDALIGRLTLLGADGIEERDQTTLARGGALGVTLVANFATRALADEAAREIGANARVEEIVGDAWRDAWKAHWGPTRLGTRIVVVPTWVQYDAGDRDVVMRLDPGRAFGTGQHASTALAAAALERRISEGFGETLLDLGCGSGILSFAAVMLGARDAIACDIDPEAIEAARENALALRLTDRVALRVGGCESVPERSRLVVANIEAAVLIPLADVVAARVLPGGALVLSGILRDQRAAVEAAYERAGLTAVRCDERDGWVAPELVRAP